MNSDISHDELLTCMQRIEQLVNDVGDDDLVHCSQVLVR